MRILRSLLWRILAFTPYELIRRENKPFLPEGNIEPIRIALAYYLASRSDVIFVQIGACDGVSEDPVHDFVKRGKMRAVLVEPIESSFVKLKHTYEKISNVSCVHAAIGEENGEKSFFVVREGAASFDPYWSPQLASFSKAHLVKHGVPLGDINEVKVPVLTLETLFTKYKLEKIDILQIDTEGFDGEIVRMALDLPHIPECINFEHVHLNDVERTELFKLLSERGFGWAHDQSNTIALNQTFGQR